MQTVLEILAAFWSVLAEMSPYLLLGFLIAGLLSVLLPPAFVERHLGRGRFWPVVKASAMGVPLPLCSCGVIPVSASLYRHGAGRGATTAFLISTPQTGVDSILVTFSLLGPVFAIFRPLVALLSGILGGLVMGFSDSRAMPAVAAAEPQGACASGDACEPPQPQAPASVVGKLRASVSYGFGALPRDIGRTLLLGLTLAALVSALVPPGFLASAFGLDATGGLWRDLTVMVLMVVIAVPIYVCATGSVPLAAALILGGISPGAALVFLMSGPATNAATIATIWKVMGRRAATIYVGTVVVSAIGAGLLMDYVFRIANIVPVAGGHSMLPTWIRNLAAVVLLAVLAAAILGPRLRRSKAAPAAPARTQRITLEVVGMTCTHCRNAVHRALSEQPGVESVHVDLEGGQAIVAGQSLDGVALAGAVEALGYRTSPAPAMPGAAKVGPT